MTTATVSHSHRTTADKAVFLLRILGGASDTADSRRTEQRTHARRDISRAAWIYLTRQGVSRRHGHLHAALYQYAHTDRKKSESGESAEAEVLDSLVEHSLPITLLLVGETNLGVTNEVTDSGRLVCIIQG